jgi:hypothetical protein
MAGRNYRDVARLTGTTANSVAKRNRLLYKVDTRAAFSRRVERDGIPSRLRAGQDFCNWFSGLFDGEGHLGLNPVWRNGGELEYKVAAVISLRDDDIGVLRHIHESLGAGAISYRSARKTSRPAAVWQVQGVRDLAEVVIHLFDQYPLRSKKGREYEWWRRAVLRKYVASMGGESPAYRYYTEEDWAQFSADLEGMKQARLYRPPPAKSQPRPA